MVAYDIDWFIEDQVIMHRFPATVDLEQLTEQFNTINDMIDENANVPLIHVLMNAEDLRQYPKQMAKLGGTVKKLLDNSRLGWVIIFGSDDRIVKFIASAIASMFKTRFRFFYTQEEAFAFLNSVDENLPDLSKYLTT
ncbi:MAG: hypothetical protein H6670_00940 [Anaerolineaceae bacterium]|nr:hypothetical protein [Anaerolineaceae bacterium]